MPCQFPAEGVTPSVEFTFVAGPSDKHELAALLEHTELPDTTFRFTVCVEDGLLRLALGSMRRDFKDPAAADLLGRLFHTIFVEARLRPLLVETPVAALIERDHIYEKTNFTQEAHLFRTLGTLTDSDLLNIRRADDSGLEALRIAASNVTRALQHHWNQEDKLKLHFFPVGQGPADRKIQILVSDGSGAHVPLNRRGEGLRWFLALFVEIEQRSFRDSLCKLLVIDEPGVYLHPEGQADLRSLLQAHCASSKHQLVYTTHSPFMLNWSRPHEVRVVHRAEGEPTNTSIIVDKPYHGGDRLRFWEPFRRNIGLFLGDLGLLGKNNLFVEGPSEHILLPFLAPQLSDWRIIPIENEYALLLMVQVCLADEDRKAVVLVDGDDQGRRYRDKLVEEKCNARIYSLTEFCYMPDDRVAMCLEDFMSREQYLRAVNATYTEETAGYVEIPHELIATLDRGVPVARHIEEIFESRRQRFKKADVAIHVASCEMEFDQDMFAGNIDALVHRIETGSGAIVLGKVAAPDPTPEAGSSLVVSLVFQRTVGVKSIVITAAGSIALPLGGETWHFPPLPDATLSTQQGNEELGGDSGRPNNAASATSSSIPEIETRSVDGNEIAANGSDSSAPTTTAESESSAGAADENQINTQPLPSPDIAVFDCWERHWVNRPLGPFLEGGAAIVRISDCPALQHANELNFTINYVTGDPESLSASLMFIKNVQVGDKLEGVVIDDSTPQGYHIRIFGSRTEALVRYFRAGGRQFRNGDRVRGRVVGMSTRGRFELDLTQP